MKKTTSKAASEAKTAIKNTENRRLGEPFQFPALTRADVAQALADSAGRMKPNRADTRKALAMQDWQMMRLANKILENSCESGAYWQLCEEAAEGD